MKPRSDIVPSIVCAFGAALWGLYWIPVRGIENAGVEPIWTGPVIFAASTLLFAPYMLARSRVFLASWRDILLPGLLAGSAFALYIAAISFTDVVRAILLFYMSPLWSTLLGVLLLKERLTINRVIGLMLAALGLYIILVVESGLPIPRNIGDWFALISGACWSVASVKLFQGGTRLIGEKVAVFVFFALILSLGLTLFHQGDLGGAPDIATLGKAWFWIVLITLVMAPVCYMTLWPTSILSPGRVGMLLLAEVIVGVASAAILLDEPFGTREILGTLLIVSAGVVEVIRQQSIAESGMIGDQT